MLRKILLAASFFFTVSAQANLIENGDFENGLTGWDSEFGRVNVVERGGNHVAKLNDRDSDGLEVLWQSFYIPTEVNTISFSFDFKFDGWDRSRRQEDSAGTLLEIRDGIRSWWDWSPWSVVEAVDFDLNSGWLSFYGEYDVSSIVDKNPNGRVFFGIFEDSGWCRDFTDSALFIDNVVVKSVASVPEPASIALLMLGFVGLLLARRRSL